MADTSLTDPLFAFSRARIAEEVAGAEAATPGPWTTRNLGRHDGSAVLVDSGQRTPAGIPPGPALLSAEGTGAVPNAGYVARQHPPATLARCAVLTELLDRCEQMLRLTSTLGPTGPLRAFVIETLRRVAAIWSWHPDYQQEWTP